MSDSVRPHRRQPTRLPRPWDSPGKNTGVPLGWPWEAQSSPRVARESWGWRSSHCRAEETSPRRVGARRGGQGSCGGGKEVAGGGCWLEARGGREFARSEACLVFSGGAAPWAWDLQAGSHTMPPGSALLLSPFQLRARWGKLYPRLCQGTSRGPGH